MQVFNACDVNSSGKIELREFRKLVTEVRALSAKKQEDEELVRSTFERFDVNGDGVIDKREIKAALKELGLGDNREELKQAWAPLQQTVAVVLAGEPMSDSCGSACSQEGRSRARSCRCSPHTTPTLAANSN